MEVPDRVRSFGGYNMLFSLSRHLTRNTKPRTMPGLCTSSMALHFIVFIRAIS